MGGRLRSGQRRAAIGHCGCFGSRRRNWTGERGQLAAQAGTASKVHAPHPAATHSQAQRPVPQGPAIVPNLPASGASPS